MKKIAVLLNGAGNRDGSEIHEAVLTLLAIEESGATWDAIALNRDQASVINHATGKPETHEHRNMLIESARIARGRIKDLTQANISDYDALIIPGGSGTAKNLCDFASSGAKMTVDPAVTEWILSFQNMGKPIGAICIAPILLAKIFGSKKIKLTLGTQDNDAAKAATTMGATHVACSSLDIVVDDRLNIVTTPAYMYDTDIKSVATGIRKLVHAILALQVKEHHGF